ncbi:MAG: DHH family phosphoesterase [Phycisphaerae bacterium]|nr:DHH family phosphoesterase [Phycisphaerae bacterium]
MTNPIRKIAKRISSSNSILWLTHVHPDGDGLGAGAALSIAAGAAGKKVIPFVVEHVPWRYKFLFDHKFPVISAQSDFATTAAEVDLVVVLDTCSHSQLGDLDAPVEAVKDKVVVIDHHATHDEIGSLRWVDPTAAATGVMMEELFDELGWPLGDAGEALATAILSDTGWLRFANTDSRCMTAMGRLLDAGVELDVIYRQMYQADRIERLKLFGRVLDGMELVCDGKVAVMSLRDSDFEQTGARRDETENLINEALRLKSVEVAIMLIENSTECSASSAKDSEKNSVKNAGSYLVRVSLRSRSLVDVAQVAAEFGGGGHSRAAGLKSDENIDALKQRVVESIAKKLQV